MNPAQDPGKLSIICNFRKAVSFDTLAPCLGLVPFSSKLVCVWVCGRRSRQAAIVSFALHLCMVCFFRPGLLAVQCSSLQSFKHWVGYRCLYVSSLKYQEFFGRKHNYRLLLRSDETKVTDQCRDQRARSRLAFRLNQRLN
jgi:hypothetical protein